MGTPDRADAAVRELAEETGLIGEVERHPWTIEHPDRVAHYFLVDVEPGPMAVGGPEVVTRSGSNRYTPEWISLGALDAENLRPEQLRRLLPALR